MEIVITLPDDLVQFAEEAARQSGVSLSSYCSQVPARSLRRELQRGDEDEITRNLNEVYSQVDSSLDPVMARMQFESLDPQDW